MGRLLNAWRALCGTLPSQRMAIIEAEWAALQLDVSNVMEQVGRWAGREAKRAAREAKRLEEPPTPTERAAPAPDRKSALRTRAFQLRNPPPEQKEA